MNNVNTKNISRRAFLNTSANIGALAAFQMALPAWARSSTHGNTGIKQLSGNKFDLSIGKFPVNIGGRQGMALGVNNTLPAPLLRFKEGEKIELNVTNRLAVDSSIHWHGLLVPFYMDGVPGISFPGIKAGETFKYEFAVPQNGTYWYHSHSGLQEQLGHYGPIIIDPAGADPVGYDREYVLVLSDWSFESPHTIFGKLKKNAESMNFQKTTLANGDRAKLEDPAMWARMRMSPTDIADVTGATYKYLINGHTTPDNWNGIFNAGERVRLRIINASAMSIFNFRIPDLPMTVVASDGLNVRPIETDEFQIGVAETYDVVVTPKENRAYALVAESIDRSGQAVATLGPNTGMRAKEPQMRERPLLTMKDMGMDHSGMDMSSDNSSDIAGMDHSKMDHGSMDMSGDGIAPMVERGPGVMNIAAMPTSRLNEPGLGLEDVPHRTLTYSQLRSLEPNKDTRKPAREIELHLTSNMERYMWSFNGVKFAHIKEPIIFNEGERLRLTMINDTMMTHPIHLHGMFFDLVNGGGNHMPRKHTVNVKPAEKLSVDISADHVGDWAFHCHLLYHMHAGMMQVVSVLPKDKAMKRDPMEHKPMDHSTMDHSKMGHSEKAKAKPNKEEMDHGTMDHSKHNGGGM